MYKFLWIWNEGQAAAVGLELLPVVCESIHFLYFLLLFWGWRLGNNVKYDYTVRPLKQLTSYKLFTWSDKFKEMGEADYKCDRDFKLFFFLT